jgi:hypothetical protein
MLRLEARNVQHEAPIGAALVRALSGGNRMKMTNFEKRFVSPKALSDF